MRRSFGVIAISVCCGHCALTYRVSCLLCIHVQNDTSALYSTPAELFDSETPQQPQLPQVEKAYQGPRTSTLPLDVPPPLPFAPSSPTIPPSMRARVLPPYPSFTYVMSQIADQSQQNQPGLYPCGDVLVKPASQPPYSKYDDNPFMVRWRLPMSIWGMKRLIENCPLRLRARAQQGLYPWRR